MHDDCPAQGLAAALSGTDALRALSVFPECAAALPSHALETELPEARAASFGQPHIVPASQPAFDVLSTFSGDVNVASHRRLSIHPGCLAL